MWAAIALGTGAASSAAHPFSITIQGVDVVDFVPFESVEVTTEVDGNGSLSFLYVDRLDGSLPITPFAYADVWVTDHVNDELLFGGVVTAMTVTRTARSRLIEVTCSGWRFLLEQAPMMRGVMAGGGAYPDYALKYFQRVMAQVPVPIHVREAPSGAVPQDLYDTYGIAVEMDFQGIEVVETAALTYWPDDSAGDALNVGNALAALSAIADRTVGQGSDWGALGSPVVTKWQGPVYIWVTPERELCVIPSGRGVRYSPLSVISDHLPFYAANTAAMESETTYEWTGLQSAVFVSDTNTSSGGDNSAFYIGDTAATNGYMVCTESLDGPLASAKDAASLGERWLAAQNAGVLSRTIRVASAEQLRAGDVLTFKTLETGDQERHVVMAVRTRFPGGTSGIRDMEIDLVPQEENWWESRSARPFGRPRTLSSEMKVKTSKSEADWFTVP